MKDKNKWLLTAVILISVFISALAQEKPPITLYHLSARIDPDKSCIYGILEITNPKGLSFMITNSLQIRKAVSDGREVTFNQKQSQFAANSSEITIQGVVPENLIIVYSGMIHEEDFPKTISYLNMIKPGLIELSDQINWFPVMKNNQPFRCKLDIDLPMNYVSVTNLFLKSQDSARERILTSWESEGPVYGITFVASPGFRKSEISRNGLRVEIYYSKLPVTYIDSMQTNLLRSFSLLAEVFGSHGAERRVRVIYSPRAAGAYARAPLIVVSENYAIEERSHEFGPARDFRLNTHEIAHYWSLADANTPDDWINEGLAEYSALLVSEEIIGKKFSDMMVGEYKEIVSNTPTTYSIVQTPGDSRDREVNRYYKPALLLNNIKEKFGEEQMKKFLRSLYSGFSDSNRANTSLFLDILEKNFGKETSDSFAESLYIKNWESHKNPENHSYSVSDTVFLGTWNGPLTQFGATVKFVLNLDIKDGKFIPTLDSPDQNVTGIPLSDLKMQDDSISFKIRVASASYRGRLDRKNLTIQGEFNQRGGTYPLNLIKDQETGQSRNPENIIVKDNGRIILAYKAFEDFLNSDRSWANYQKIVLNEYPEMKAAHKTALGWGSIDTVSFPQQVKNYKKEDWEKYFNEYDNKTLNYLFDSLIVRANKILRPVSNSPVDLCLFLPYEGCYIIPGKERSTIYISLLIDPRDVQKIMVHEYAHNLHFQRRPDEPFNLRREIVSEGMAVYLTTLILKEGGLFKAIPFMSEPSVKWCFDNEPLIKSTIKTELGDTTFNGLKRFIADGPVSSPPKGFVEKTGFFAGYRIIEACIKKGMKLEDICALSSESILDISGYFN